MEYKNYKVIRGVYGGTAAEFITIPSTLTLVTGGKHDIGGSLTDGHLHYIAYVNAPEEAVAKNCDGYAVSVQKFRENDCFILIHDVRFVDNYDGLIINPDEMRKGIYAKSLSDWNQEIGIDIPSNDFEYVAFWKLNGKLIKMSKITKITSEFDIQLNSVWNHSDIYNSDVRMVEQENIELSALCLPRGFAKTKGIMVNGDVANAYYQTLLRNVLNKYGVMVHPNQKIKWIENLDHLYDILKEFVDGGDLDGEKVDKVMKMIEV